MVRVIRGKVYSKTSLENGMDVFRFNECTLLNAAPGESFSRDDMFLTIAAETDTFKTGKHYDMTISDVAVEDIPVPEPPSEPPTARRKK